MTEPRILPPLDARAETGPLQFGDDWPGVFIRGDNAHWYAAHLRALLDGAPDEMLRWSRPVCEGLAQLLESSRVTGPAAGADGAAGNQAGNEGPPG